MDSRAIKTNNYSFVGPLRIWNSDTNNPILTLACVSVVWNVSIAFSTYHVWTHSETTAAKALLSLQQAQQT